MENVVYMIGEKATGRILDCNRHALVEKISFHSFFPSRDMAENFKSREMGDRQGKYYTVVEGEIVEFLNNELTVAHEDFIEENYDIDSLLRSW